MRIDSHQHFWQYNPAEFGWIGPTMSHLQRDFLPADLEPELAQAGIDGTVAVQARQTVDETRWLLEMAEANSFIKGVVGWVDLCAENIESQLKQLTRSPLLKGVRHVVQDEPDERFMLRPDFLHGLSLLQSFNLTYDLLLFPIHLPVALEVVQHFPKQRFVLNHIAKPLIKDKRLAPWQGLIRELATCPNVFCKVSGMVTEADWTQWQPDDFRPYLDVVFACFGTDRLLFGSDWPVCTVAAPYSEVVGLIDNYIEAFPASERDQIFGGNAAMVYRL